jgi:hypothetical protein
MTAPKRGISPKDLRAHRKDGREKDGGVGKHRFPCTIGAIILTLLPSDLMIQ